MVAACNIPQVKNIVFELKNKIPSFVLISTVIKQKLQITNGTHPKSAKILKDVPTLNSKSIEVLIPGKIFQINCEINVSQLAENLHSGLPKFTTTATCTENCGSYKTL